MFARFLRWLFGCQRPVEAFHSLERVLQDVPEAWPLLSAGRRALIDDEPDTLKEVVTALGYLQATNYYA